MPKPAQKPDPAEKREDGSCAPEDAGPRTAPVNERVAEGEVTIRVPEVDQLSKLYGTKTEDTAGLLLKSALGAFGRKAEAYFELMPAMAWRSNRAMRSRRCW